MLKALSHDEFMTRVYRDLEKPKAIKNDADKYLFEKALRCQKKDAMHKKRMPGFRSN